MKFFRQNMMLSKINNLPLLIPTLISIILMLSQPVIADDIEELVKEQKTKEKQTINKQHKEDLRMKNAADRIDEVANIVEELFEELLKKGLEFDEFGSSWEKYGQLKYNNKLYIKNEAKKGIKSSSGYTFLDPVNRVRGYISFIPKDNDVSSIEVNASLVSDDWEILICKGELCSVFYKNRSEMYAIKLNSIFDSKELLKKKNILKEYIIKFLKKRMITNQN